MDITKIQSAGYKITYIAQPGETGPRVLVDWRSPFSREATAAIKASFTGAQWETIKAWGKTADAYLIAAVNQFAVEDPRIMCSLVSGLGITRWLKGDGAGSTGSYIIIDYYPNNATKLDVMFETCSTSNNYCGLFSGDTNYDHVDCYYWSGSLYYYNSMNYRVGMGYVYRLLDEGSTIYVYKDGALDHTRNVSKGTFTSNTKLGLFCLHRNNAVSYRGPHKISYVKIEDNSTSLHLIPCIHNGAAGMLDVLSNTFYGNNGDGTFTTIEEV